MSVIQQLQDRIDREDQRIADLEAQLPDLQARLESAEKTADEVEANLLVRDATEGVFEDTTQSTDEALRRAKVAAHQRRKALEQAEREARVARHVRDRLQTTLQSLQDTDVDGQLADLDARVPEVATALADAWASLEEAAEQAENLRREHRRLKALVPVKGVRLPLTHQVPRFSFVEEIRARGPRNSMRHPASVLKRFGFHELAERVKGAA